MLTCKTRSSPWFWLRSCAYSCALAFSRFQQIRGYKLGVVAACCLNHFSSASPVSIALGFWGAVKLSIDRVARGSRSIEKNSGGSRIATRIAHVIDVKSVPHPGLQERAVARMSKCKIRCWSEHHSALTTKVLRHRKSSIIIVA